MVKLKALVAILIVFNPIFLATLPIVSSSTSPTIKSTGEINYSGFRMRGANVEINHFHPSAINYQPNVWNILKDLGINVIRVGGGLEGDVVHFQMRDYPNEWAQNLDAFLAEADSHGVKVWFNTMGSPWYTLFGIVSPGYTNVPAPATSIDEAKAMVDQLAGNNNLGHNFMTDPRVIGWVTSNEVDISSPEVLDWNIQLCDYIRSKGGKAWLGSPRYGEWFTGERLDVIEPLLRGHVDYLERHPYEVWDFDELGRDYSSFYNYYKQFLQEHMLNGRGNYSVDQLIIGEFGIWRGYASDVGYTGSFTDEERRTYYQAVYDALRDMGMKNIVFFLLFSAKYADGTIETPDYGVVDVYGNYYPYVHDVIRQAYK